MSTVTVSYPTSPGTAPGTPTVIVETIDAPPNLISTTIQVYVEGGNTFGNGPVGFKGAYVKGTIPASMFPLTAVVAQAFNPPQLGSSGDAKGFNGFSGGGCTEGNSLPSTESNGGGGSSALLSGGAVLIEAGGADAPDYLISGVSFPGGTGGGAQSNTPTAPLTGSAGAGSGGAGGGSGGSSFADGGTPGTGYGIVGNNGANGNSGTLTESGAGQGSASPLLSAVNPTGGNIAGSTVSSSVTPYSYGPGIIGWPCVQLTYDIADAPTTNQTNVVSPTEYSYVDPLTSGITFILNYETGDDADTGLLSAVCLVAEIGSTFYYWTGQAWQSFSWEDEWPAAWIIPTTGLSAQNGDPFSIYVPASAFEAIEFTDGTSIAWMVGCEESFVGAQSPIWTDFLGLYTQAAPVLTLVEPLGTVTTLTPTVGWSATFAEGAQTYYRYVVYDSPQNTANIPIDESDITITPADPAAVWDSTYLSSSTPSFVWSEGATYLMSDDTTIYYEYLQIIDTSGVVSEWASGTFTVAATYGSAPTLTVTAGTDPTTEMAAPYLSMTGSDDWASGVKAQFQGNYGVGGAYIDSVMNPVTPTESGSNADASTYDLSAPFNVAVTFQGRYYYTSGKQTYFTPWSDPVTLESGVPSLYWWIVPPGAPEDAMKLYRLPSSGSSTSSSSDVATPTTPAMPSNMVASILIEQWEQMGIFRPFGKANAIIVHGDLWNPEFDLDLYFESTDAWDQFDSIRANQTAILLKSDMEGSTYWVTLGPDLNPGIVSRTARQSNPTRGLTVHCTPTDPDLTTLY